MNDKKKAFFRGLGYTGTLPDMENRYLRTQASPYVGSIPDMWKKYLTGLGYTGTVPELIKKWRAAGNGW